jgi:hypothetical protein
VAFVHEVGMQNLWIITFVLSSTSYDDLRVYFVFLPSWFVAMKLSFCLGSGDEKWIFVCYFAQEVPEGIDGSCRYGHTNFILLNYHSMDMAVPALWHSSFPLDYYCQPEDKVESRLY